MTARAPDLRSALRATASWPALLVLGLSLGGCADMGDSFVSSAFVDPAKYENFDCKQLEAERKMLALRSAELQGLMAKAETGTGGAVISELAYRNDYISVRGQARLAEETWRRNKCVAGAPAVATPAAPAPEKSQGPASRSGSGLY
jgi:hypothetical protein